MWPLDQKNTVLDLKFLSLAISDTFDISNIHNAADLLKWLINTLHEEALSIQIQGLLEGGDKEEEAKITQESPIFKTMPNISKSFKIPRHDIETEPKKDRKHINRQTRDQDELMDIIVAPTFQYNISEESHESYNEKIIIKKQASLNSNQSSKQGFFIEKNHATNRDSKIRPKS